MLTGGPEALFHVDPVRSLDGVVNGSMAMGPWCSAPDGRFSPGSLGVLADNVLGWALVGQVYPERWSVSTEISLDLLSRPGSGTLTGSARVLHTDPDGALSTGEIRDDQHNLVAVCRQRGRFVHASVSNPDYATGAAAPGDVADDGDVLRLLGATVTATATGARLALGVAPRLANPLRNAHGGILLCASELAGSAALADGPELVTSSVHITFVRAVPAGSQLTFEADIRHRGRTLGVSEVVGRSDDGRACTVATVTGQAPS